MKAFAALGIFAALAVSVATGPALAQGLESRPGLIFADEGDGFARSVRARYGAGTPAAAVRADARAQGFSCTADGESCTRVVMDGTCANTWILDIGADQSVSGQYQYRCMGAAVDDE